MTFQHEVEGGLFFFLIAALAGSGFNVAMNVIELGERPAFDPNQVEHVSTVTYSFGHGAAWQVIGTWKQVARHRRRGVDDPAGRSMFEVPRVDHTYTLNTAADDRTATAVDEAVTEVLTEWNAQNPR